LGGQPLTDSGDEIDLRELWRALRRRKKLVAVTAASVVTLAGLLTLYQRVFTPVYKGSFSLLITDPISSDGGSGGRAAADAASGTMFEALARNTTSNDIPTLIEVLRSPLLLSPIANRFDLTPKGLASRIEISTGGEKRQEAEGVLKVGLTEARISAALAIAHLCARSGEAQQMVLATEAVPVLMAVQGARMLALDALLAQQADRLGAFQRAAAAFALLLGRNPPDPPAAEGRLSGFEAILGFPVIPPGRSFPGPALFLGGGRSDYLRPEHRPEIERLFPAATIETIPEAGHWVHADAPEAFVAAVNRFLGRS